MAKNTQMCYFLLILGLLVTEGLGHTMTGECGYVYTEKNKGGNSYKVCHYGNLPAGFNNQVSSIFVPKGFNMRLYKDSGRTGPWIDIPGGLWNANAEWDNVISSVLYNNWQGCSHFYSGAGQTGKSFLVCETGNLVAGYNDRVASVAVAPRHFFRLYKGPNQTGDWYDIRGKWNLRSDFVNNVKSMKLQHWSDCAWTYSGQNKKGKLFEICDSASYFPSGYDNWINSIVVPKKMTVTVYKEPNYGGASLKITQGTWNAPSDWKNSISSIKISIDGVMKNKD